jgi:NAD(P)-dependent dehydrogenase (short-subunit alcohol dehydrogenase family)
VGPDPPREPQGPHRLHPCGAGRDDRKGYGKIVNIASDAGRVGSTGEAVYSAAKGGIIAFTKTIARETAGSALNVNCVCPARRTRRCSRRWRRAIPSWRRASSA